MLEFITAVLPMLRRRIKSLLPPIVQNAPLLSHFIHEMIKFDTILREEYFYAPFGSNPETQWKGITHEVLVKQNWFGPWLDVEKSCKPILCCSLGLRSQNPDLSPFIVALSRYQNILVAKDAWEIDYDSVEEREAKPTKSAIRLKDLLEAITGRRQQVHKCPAVTNKNPERRSISTAHFLCSTASILD